MPVRERLPAAPWLALLLAALLALIPSLPAAAKTAETAQDKQTRFSIVNGCYSLRSTALNRVVAGDIGPFRMQATELGQYLLYGKARDFLGADSNGAVGSQREPSPSADWRVDEAGNGTFKLVLSSGRALTAGPDGRLSLGDPGSRAALFAFEAANGCPGYPEIETSASGKPLTSKTPWGEIRGMMDLHMHMTAYEFLGGRLHCGRPWHRYGAPYALVDCPDHQPNGAGAAVENVLSNGSPVGTHDPVGWPTFRDWPRHNSLTHEQTYYKWLERSYLAGLRVVVNLFPENKVLCELYPLKQNSCDEMDSVRLQNRRIEELENYIDAQNGGPGKGWFRLVRDPFEARRVIAQGKLAVIKGIEISQPFGCRVYNDQPMCDRARIDRELNEVHGFGVRQMEIINKFDNALAGVAGDAGSTGVVVNTGNRLETGKYWEMQACQGAKDEEDRRQIGVYEHDENDVGSAVIEQFLPLGTAPVYPRGANCNARGLTELGEYAVRRLMDKKMVIDPDHLGVRARKGLLSLLEARRYSGAVSSHTWSTPDAEQRIYNLGGLVTPMQDSADEWVKHWRELRVKADRDTYYFGHGFGDDQNGFANQFGPRPGGNVRYPFKSFDGGVTFDRQKSGSRVFDLNKDGMAHYGLFADWFEDIRNVGGPTALNEMARGAEAYLQMWERANGIGFGCKSGREHFTRRGLGRFELGASTARMLRRNGQPGVRGNRAWTWCAKRKKNRGKKIVAVVTKTGKIALVGSSAHGHRGLRIRVGVKAKRLRGKARKMGKGLYVRRAGRRSRFVYGVRRGRVSFVAVATRSAAKNRRVLRSYLKLGRLR